MIVQRHFWCFWDFQGALAGLQQHWRWLLIDIRGLWGTWVVSDDFEESLCPTNNPVDSPDGSSPSRRSREMIFALPIFLLSLQRRVRQVRDRNGQQNDPRCCPDSNLLRSHNTAWMTPHTLWYRLTNVPNARTNLLKYLGGYRSAQRDPKPSHMKL